MPFALTSIQLESALKKPGSRSAAFLKKRAKISRWFSL
jgi:hypothetical protein